MIAADHPDSAADEVIEEAGFVVDPTADAVAEALDRALAGDRPRQNPRNRAAQFDWDNVAARAESTYRRAVFGQW